MNDADTNSILVTNLQPFSSNFVQDINLFRGRIYCQAVGSILVATVARLDFKIWFGTKKMGNGIVAERRNTVFAQLDQLLVTIRAQEERQRYVLPKITTSVFKSFKTRTVYEPV